MHCEVGRSSENVQGSPLGDSPRPHRASWPCSQQGGRDTGSCRPLVHATSEGLEKTEKYSAAAAWCLVLRKCPSSSLKTRSLCKARFAEQDQVIQTRM